jgi:hypothetical protein
MSRYEELAEIARTAQKRRDERNTQVRNYIDTFLAKFAAYSGMPLDRVKLLPWMEEAQVFQANSDEIYGLWQAIHFDEDKEEWGVGVCIILTPPKNLPRRAVTAGLFVKEDDGGYTVRCGSQTYQNVDLNVQTVYEPVFESIFAELKAAFAGTKKNVCGKYGFRIEQANA